MLHHTWDADFASLIGTTVTIVNVEHTNTLQIITIDVWVRNKGNGCEPRHGVFACVHQKRLCWEGMNSRTSSSTPMQAYDDATARENVTRLLQTESTRDVQWASELHRWPIRNGNKLHCVATPARERAPHDTHMNKLVHMWLLYGSGVLWQKEIVWQHLWQ